MELVVLIGIPATGKSSFARERFAETHLRLNLDMLRTRHREDVLFRACLEAKQPVVVDNTNTTRVERARYVAAAKAAGFRVVGYYFSSRVGDALARNATRSGEARVPDAAVLGMAGRLELPRLDEGFDALHFVRLEGPAFVVEGWRDEV